MRETKMLDYYGKIINSIGGDLWYADFIAFHYAKTYKGFKIQQGGATTIVSNPATGESVSVTVWDKPDRPKVLYNATYTHPRKNINKVEFFNN